MISKKLILTRPYSFAFVASIGLIANLIMNNELLINFELAIDIAVPLLIWSAILLFVEMRHKQQYRPKITYAHFLLAFIPLILLMAIREPLSIVFLIIGLPLAYLYSLKSIFSFVFRGMKEVLIFLIVMMFYLHEFNSLFSEIVNLWQLILIIYLLPTSRNLIGDMRDIKEDKHTFARKIGEKVTLLLSGFLLIILVYLAPSVFVAFPVVICLAIMLLSKNNYFLHKMFIVSSTAFFFNYIFYILSYHLFISNFMFLGFLLMVSYDYMPRKINIKYLEGVIEWVKR